MGGVFFPELGNFLISDRKISYGVMQRVEPQASPNLSTYAARSVHVLMLSNYLYL